MRVLRNSLVLILTTFLDTVFSCVATSGGSTPIVSSTVSPECQCTLSQVTFTPPADANYAVSTGVIETTDCNTMTVSCTADNGKFASFELNDNDGSVSEAEPIRQTVSFPLNCEDGQWYYITLTPPVVRVTCEQFG